MKFEPGIYYVGDPGFVLPNDDLRMLFAEMMQGNFKTGKRMVVESIQIQFNGDLICDYFWAAKTPSRNGTLYDQNNKGWGFDWGCFGVVPWKWTTFKGTYNENKIEFNESFECSLTDDGIAIGHFNFTFNSK